MSAMELLDALADAWLAWAWRAASASLVLLVALLLLRPLLARFASTHLATWLWLVPIVPLVAPPVGLVRLDCLAPEAPVSLRASGDARPSGPRLEPVAAPLPRGGSAPAHGPAAGASDPEAVLTSAGRSATAPRSAAARSALQGLLTWLALAWWCTSLAVLVTFVLRQREVRRLVRGSRPCANSELRRRFRVLARESGIRGSVELRVHRELGSPATAGLLRSVVLVPEALFARLDADALEWVLRHELAHVRRRDVLLDAALRVVRAVWIAHPAAWVCPALFARERELACDEAALSRSGRALGPRAASALLAVLELDGPRPAELTGSVPFFSSSSLQRTRIMRLIRPHRRATRGLTPLSTLVLLSAAAVALPGAAPSESRVEDQEPLAEELELVEPVLEDEVDTTIAASLRYLVSRQEQDGRWRATTAPDETGTGELDDVGVTAAVVLALIDAPPGVDVPGRAAAVERALSFFAAGQDEKTGAFSALTSNIYLVPSHAMALSAWIRAHRGTDGAEWRGVAQRGIEFALRARNTYAGWRYSYPPIGDNDSVMTGWMLLALADARDAGLAVDDAAVQGGFDVLDELTDPETGRTGYNARGTPTSRLSVKAEDFPGEEVEFPTAVALCARLAWDQDPVEVEAMLTGATLLARKPPLWSTARGSIDSYYWAFGTRALAGYGGLLARRWEAGLREALLGNVERDDEGRAHWPAVDAWSAPGSEVHMTAFCTLALEALR
jgi:beta-lactamase regulating signal transducer with metallopeptidase domain